MCYDDKVFIEIATVRKHGPLGRTATGFMVNLCYGQGTETEFVVY